MIGKSYRRTMTIMKSERQRAEYSGGLSYHEKGERLEMRGIEDAKIRGLGDSRSG
jgi:hypothetical protein